MSATVDLNAILNRPAVTKEELVRANKLTMPLTPTAKSEAEPAPVDESTVEFKAKQAKAQANLAASREKRAADKAKAEAEANEAKAKAAVETPAVTEPVKPVETAIETGKVSEFVPQPDASGEFASPADGAKFMASFGVPQTPLRDKVAFLPAWQDRGSCDFAQIDAWAEEFSACNFGSIAQLIPGKPFAFEADSLDVKKRFQKDTGETGFTRTLTVESRPGRGHRWLIATADSVALGNIGQQAVIGKDFSVRAGSEYCVSCGSLHPETGKQYRVVVNIPPVAISAKEVNWMRSQRIEAKKVLPSDGPIESGSRNNTLASLAGVMWQKGMGSESILAALKVENETRCIPPLSDQEVETIHHSITTNYPQGNCGIVTIGGRLLGGNVPNVVVPEKPQYDLSPAATYPKFPRWVLDGTSLYNGLAKVAAETSAKYPEMVWMPAMQILLNYLSLRVHSGIRSVFNMNVGIVGPAEFYFKSSSCDLAIDYMKQAGMSDHYRIGTKSEGKTIIHTVGSSEAFGLDMSEINAKNGILYFDELSNFTGKAGIENSSFLSHMLTMYESGKFSNSVKNRKQRFMFDPMTYCFGWLWCTTDTDFDQNWSKLRGRSSGLDSRMFFLLPPEVPKPAIIPTTPAILPGAVETRRLVNKAMDQRKYHYEDLGFAQRAVVEGGPRCGGWIEKLALGFAVDLGLDIITDDCVERAKALADYQKAVIPYLDPIQAETIQGRIQLSILKLLRLNTGEMENRVLERKGHAERYGTRVWSDAFMGLVKSGQVEADFNSRPKMVRLLKQDD